MRMRTALFGRIASGLLAMALVGPAAIFRIEVAHAEEAGQSDPFGRFTVNELEAKIKEAKAGKLKLFIYDNNSRERFTKSHVPTARWIDYTKIQLGDLPKEKDATLVFYCANEH